MTKATGCAWCVFLLLSEFLLHSCVALASSRAAGVEIRRAILPDDLADIQECRRDAYKGQKNLLTAARSFCNAEQIQREGYVCIIAKEKAAPFRVLGTADLSLRRQVVNNVYVLKEARKQGLGRQLMEAVEDVLDDRPATLKLSVYSTNTPAVALYKSLGFQTPGIHSVMEGLSSATSLNLLLQMEKRLS